MNYLPTACKHTFKLHTLIVKPIVFLVNKIGVKFYGFRLSIWHIQKILLCFDFQFPLLIYNNKKRACKIYNWNSEQKIKKFPPVNNSLIDYAVKRYDKTFAIESDVINEKFTAREILRFLSKM